MLPSRRLSMLIALTLSACGGGGGDGGGGGGGGDPPIEATLASIQANVFTPICTSCHAGGAAPQGLRLEDGVSFAMLVNVPSVEVPSILRVDPGNPDDSYLIQKIEGTAAVGGRMPLGGSRLPQPTIDAMRQWITDGATETAVALASARAATIEMLAPMPESQIKPEDAPPVAELLVAADKALDFTLLTAGTMTLEASGGDGSFREGNERPIAFRIVVTQHTPSVVRLIPAAGFGPDNYRLRVSGTAPLALADLNSIAIDGDGDGVPGGDYVVEFAAGIRR